MDKSTTTTTISSATTMLHYAQLANEQLKLKARMKEIMSPELRAYCAQRKREFAVEIAKLKYKEKLNQPENQEEEEDTTEKKPFRFSCIITYWTERDQDIFFVNDATELTSMKEIEKLLAETAGGDTKYIKKVSIAGYADTPKDLPDWFIPGQSLYAPDEFPKEYDDYDETGDRLFAFWNLLDEQNKKIHVLQSEIEKLKKKE